ncbi:MAG: hypothetical protein Q4A23_01500 [bacterium]|nr:hypothetical protein [bacterium]
MKNFNSFNTQPEPLENKPDSFNNITYDKAGTSLDNIVGDLRDYHKEMSLVVAPNSHKDTLQQRLLDEGSAKHEPISSILKMDNDNYIVTYAGYMGLTETNRYGKVQLADLIDMSDKDEDFNPYKGLTIGQSTNRGNTPLALTVFNRGTRSVADTSDNAGYLKFKKGLSQQIMDYYENMK